MLENTHNDHTEEQQQSTIIEQSSTQRTDEREREMGRGGLGRTLEVLLVYYISVMLRVYGDVYVLR